MRDCNNGCTREDNNNSRLLVQSTLQWGFLSLVMMLLHTKEVTSTVSGLFKVLTRSLNVLPLPSHSKTHSLEFLNCNPKIKTIIAKEPPKDSKIDTTKIYHEGLGIVIGVDSINDTPQTTPSIMLYDAGYYYEGSWKDGKRHGAGRMISKDGDSYQGAWQNNLPSGYGVYNSADGVFHAGNWENGIQSGPGTQSHPNGLSYNGNFQEGKKHGKGILTLQNGEFYEGDFSQNMPTGQGMYLNKSIRYKGSWRNGKMHGEGKCQYLSFSVSGGSRIPKAIPLAQKTPQKSVFNSIWANSALSSIEETPQTYYRVISEAARKKCPIYFGQFREGLRNGYGEYHWPDGSVYKGTWHDDQMLGEGIFKQQQEEI